MNGYKITGLTINKPVTDPVMIGGLFGYTNGATISNVSLEDINVTSLGWVGGLVGIAVDPSTVAVTNSYWDKETTLQEESAGGVGKLTDAMMKQVTYEDWDFDTVWESLLKIIQH